MPRSPRNDLDIVTADARSVSRRLAQAEDAGDWREFNRLSRVLDALIDHGKRLQAADEREGAA